MELSFVGATGSESKTASTKTEFYMK